jgi:hypothetical protein
VGCDLFAELVQIVRRRDRAGLRRSQPPLAYRGFPRTFCRSAGDGRCGSGIGQLVDDPLPICGRATWNATGDAAVSSTHVEVSVEIPNSADSLLLAFFTTTEVADYDLVGGGSSTGA